MFSKSLVYVLSAVVVVGGGYYLASHSGALGSSEGEQAAVEAAPAAESGQTFAQIITMGDVECDMTSVQNGAAVQGTLHVASSGAQVEGTFSTTVAGRAMQSHLIKSGGYVYVWSDAYPQGVKTAATPDEDPLAAMNSGTVPPGTSYECHPWKTDSSVFAVPTDVRFQEMPVQR